MGGEGAVLAEQLKRAEAAGRAGASVILVEGVSDQRALEALARSLGRDLEADGVAVIPTAGITNVRRFLELLGPSGHNVSLAGLCDEGEASAFAMAAQAAGLGIVTGRDDLERHGFYVCVTDLEDELVRALGARAMVDLMESQGHLRRFRSFQNQPAQRHKTAEAQIHRWLGNHKIRYAPLMIEALEPTHAPAPLLAVLDRATTPSG